MVVDRYKADFDKLAEYHPGLVRMKLDIVKDTSRGPIDDRFESFERATDRILDVVQSDPRVPKELKTYSYRDSVILYLYYLLDTKQTKRHLH